MLRRARLAEASFAPLVAVVAAVLLAACSTSSPDSAHSGSSSAAQTWAPKVGEALAEQPVLESHDGLLEVDLRTVLTEMDVAGSPIKALGYNGAINGPTFKVKPGDNLRVTLDNGTPDMTNIHFHGMHVSSSGNGDNVFRMMEPGTVNVAEIKIPANHETGLFWYHAHMHGLTDKQVYGGMRGLIVVGDIVGAHLPGELAGITQRLLSVNDVYDQDGAVADQAASMSAATILVDGQATPHWSIAPGETQLWRFANTGADLFYQLALDGHRFSVIAEDGSPVWKVTQTDTLFLPPGKRLEVLVQGGASGEHTLVTQAIQVGPGAGNAQPEMTVAHVDVGGKAVAPLTIPTVLDGPRTEDLSTATVAQQREFTFTMKATGQSFAFVNGETFDPNRIDVQPKLGTVEEWTLKNPDTGSSTTSANHPFHIHTNDFQVMSIDGKPYAANGLQDVVVVPSGSVVVIRQRFADYSGEYVFHCHILAHEDGGMMQTVNVVP